MGPIPTASTHDGADAHLLQYAKNAVSVFPRVHHLFGCQSKSIFGQTANVTNEGNPVTNNASPATAIPSPPSWQEVPRDRPRQPLQPSNRNPIPKEFLPRKGTSSSKGLSWGSRRPPLTVDMASSSARPVGPAHPSSARETAHFPPSVKRTGSEPPTARRPEPTSAFNTPMRPVNNHPNKEYCVLITPQHMALSDQTLVNLKFWVARCDPNAYKRDEKGYYIVFGVGQAVEQKAAACRRRCLEKYHLILFNSAKVVQKDTGGLGPWN
jgi:hypothetical protein